MYIDETTRNYIVDIYIALETASLCVLMGENKLA